MTTIELLKPLSDGLARSHPGFSNSDLERAFNAANKAHSGQLRKSGEPYITHPVAVAQILTELGMDLPTVMAALLHRGGQSARDKTPRPRKAVRQDAAL